MPKTYDRWLGGTEKAIERLTRQGGEIVRIAVDLDELVQWCQAKGLHLDANARIEYANEVAATQIRARDQQRH